jgi:hypothetical protein
MRKLLVLYCFLLSLVFNGCQCSEKPDVPPVQDAGLTAASPSR